MSMRKVFRIARGHVKVAWVRGIVCWCLLRHAPFRTMHPVSTALHPDPASNTPQNSVCFAMQQWFAVFLSILCLLTHSQSVSFCADDASIAVINVEPAIVELTGPLSRSQVVVTTTMSGGRTVDVIAESTLTMSDPTVATVSRSGQAVPVANGRCLLRVLYQSQVVEVPVVVTAISNDHPVSFTEEVLPVLTKAGCNQGACHGSQFGQGNFKLSLLGYAPEHDHPAIVREASQRRVALVSPIDSLLLQKAVAAIPHGGGKRMDANSVEFQTLRRWIKSGAAGPLKSEPEIADISVTPNEREYQKNEIQQLRVVATYSDGSQRDVTHCARYDSLGKGIATVTRTGLITADGQGQAAVMVRYRGRAKVSLVVRPYAANVDLSGFHPQNFVDEHVKSRWQKIGLRPSPMCSDEEFLRRAFLSAIGTLPSQESVEAFLASNEPDKRTRLIDELLGLTGDPGRDVFIEPWSAYWTQKWGDLLRNNRDKVGEIGMWAFTNWIRGSLRENKPMDQFAAEILLAQGSIYQNGQANFYKVSSLPTDLAETTAQVFLGVRLQCAKCHQHPFESYGQSDYYGLAAFFTQVTTKRSSAFGVFGNDTVVRLKRSGSIKHPRSGAIVPPTPLGGMPMESITSRDLRKPLAEWLTSPKNPLFARNIVNRTWGHLMGVALVEPIDDLRATNPPSNTELLDSLAEEFVHDDFDLRKLMRAIMVSKTFQLTSTATGSNAGDTRFYSHFPSRRLPAEVLLDAIDTACGTRERFTGVPLGTRAIELPDPKFSSYFLDTLGRPQRIVSCECERTAEPNLAQVLQLANGELVHRKLTDTQGRISKLIESGCADEHAFIELYLVTFSRRPSAEELEHCATVVSAAADRRSGMEDVLWALINSPEFLFNH